MATPEIAEIESITKLPQGPVFLGFGDKDKESALKNGQALFVSRYGYEPVKFYWCENARLLFMEKKKK
jgi:hypothetical protein